jgi:cell division protein FtsI/penicillin-binding protein 2
MARRFQHWNLRLFGVGLIGAFAVLAVRLVDLQVLRHEVLRTEAEQNTHKQYFREARRGDILDAQGSILAGTVPVKTVSADPRMLFGKEVELARFLAPYLDLEEAELLRKLSFKTRQTASGLLITNKSVTLKKKVPVETWQQLSASLKTNMFGFDYELKKGKRVTPKNLASLRAAAVSGTDDQLRVYPQKELAAHVLGFTGEAAEPGGPISGKEGIELTFNERLSGVRGWRRTETDARRREQVTLRDEDVEPQDGCNVVLTIDGVLQHYLSDALNAAMVKHSPLSASGIIVRPRTGEILAMATVPDFDPNSPGNLPDRRRNRVITDIAEPGSTFKIVVVSAALNEKVVSLRDSFDCEHGRFFFGGRILHDHESYPVLTVESIITKSSNIGAAKIGIKLGEQRLYDYMKAFGFGAPTGIPLPGEVSARQFVQPVKNWSKVSIAQIPMGHGIAVTRLQMVMAMCAIANKGVLMRPMLVDRLVRRDGLVEAQYGPQRVRQVISEAAARDMVEALKTVPRTNGTAPKAALEHYTVAGKTGTAQKAENGVYVRGKYLSSFIGFFPADEPELCISIVLDEPKTASYYGGQIAAPIFKQVAELAANHLNIRPDIDPGIPEQTDPKVIKTTVVRGGPSPKSPMD